MDILHSSADRAYAQWYCPPAVGHIELISARLAEMHRLQITQKMKPYRKATDPPEGMTMPREPARQIQVLY